MRWVRKDQKKTVFDLKSDVIKESPLSSFSKENLNRLSKDLGSSPDLIQRTIYPDYMTKTPVGIVYISGLVKEDIINQSIVQPILNYYSPTEQKVQNTYEFIRKHVLSNANLRSENNWKQIITALLSGSTILFIEGFPSALIANVAGGVTKPISEPTSQTVIRGPKDSFTESIQTNIALVRRRIKSPNLWMHQLTIGNISQTTVSVMYINGVVNRKIVDEVIQKLSEIEIDGVLESGYLESFIEDKAFSPFPTVFSTERPDVIAGNLLEGRVAIFIDNTPYVLVAPTSFTQFFQSVEDYAQRYDIATFLRIIRYFSFIVSILAPSIYVALTAFHPEMIPTQLLVNLAGQRENLPFPSLIEALAMELTFEVIREAGIRAPKALNTAVTIVGAIVIGETAVTAGLVSPAMVIVVAITAIASFATPSFPIAISARLVRFPLIFLAATLGLFGVTIGTILIVAHMNTLHSFGVPYLAPFSPYIKEDQKDTIVRVPLWALRSRPKTLHTENPIRIPKDKKFSIQLPKGEKSE
ncbi:spore germination protein [Risungbinella massiliensis]|uniref:spore germination protein n=1 Tax=Risungbinella massiliensis TaxID=1329796 RepID=UPI0005CC272D|nr:spore germination protein [Risungbinella massiliensis]